MCGTFLIKLFAPLDNHWIIPTPRETYDLNLSALTLRIWSFRTPTSIFLYSRIENPGLLPSPRSVPQVDSFLGPTLNRVLAHTRLLVQWWVLAHSSSDEYSTPKKERKEKFPIFLLWKVRWSGLSLGDSCLETGVQALEPEVGRHGRLLELTLA